MGFSRKTLKRPLECAASSALWYLVATSFPASTKALTRKRTPKITCLVAIALALSACSALLPPDANGPKANEPAYPVLLSEDPGRLDAAVALWQRLAQAVQNSDTKSAAINPRTGTVQSLPANMTLHLPKVGTGPTMSEEERREALRRFINEWQGLVGADPAQLSLQESVDKPEGTHFVQYLQQPFRFPLRGGYGILRIGFTQDGRVVLFSSTCIPDADRLSGPIGAINPQLGWEDAATRIVGATAAFKTSDSQQRTYQLSQANQPQVRELVIYVEERAGVALAFHLAWEVSVSNAPFKNVYLDAVNGEILGAV